MRDMKTGLEICPISSFFCMIGMFIPREMEKFFICQIRKIKQNTILNGVLLIKYAILLLLRSEDLLQIHMP